MMKLVVSLGICMLFVLAGCSSTALNENELAQTEVSVPSDEKAPQFVERKGVTKGITTAPDAYEDDDNFLVWPEEIIVNAPSQERNFFDDYRDWIWFQAVAGRTYKIESWVYGACDTDLYLYSPTNMGSELVKNDDKGDGTYGSEINWYCETSDTYYIKCLSYNSKIGPNRDYELIVLDNTVARDAYEDDDTIIKATRIYATGSLQTHDFSDDSTDWIKVYMSKGYQYTMESFVSGSCDTMFKLYTETNTPLIFNDDKAGDYGSKLEYTAPATGYYYLKIFSYNGAIGPDKEYMVSVRQN